MNYEKANRISDEMGETNDCSVKALSIVCDKPYRMAHDALRKLGRRNHTGATGLTLIAAIQQFGFTVSQVQGDSPNKFGGTVSTLTRRLPSKGTYFAIVRGHVIAVRNGKVEDWTAGRRHQVKVVFKVERKERKPRHKSNKAA